MRKILLILMVLLIPQVAFGGTQERILNHETNIPYTDNYDFYVDAGLCQIYPRESPRGKYLHVEYMATEKEIRKFYAELNRVSGETKGMTDKEKISYLNGYLQKTKYGTGYSALSAIVRKDAVCEGYAMAFEILSQKCGLKSTVVVGGTKGGTHAWNEVEVNGKTYGVDTCWNEITKNPGSWEDHEKYFEKDF